MGKQEHIAVECFACHMFQSIIKSKNNHFNCKICHEKQTVRKIYAISDNGKGMVEILMLDIRGIVQKLNTEVTIPEIEVSQQKPVTEEQPEVHTENKWSKYVHEEVLHTTSEEDPMYTTVDPKTVKKRKTPTQRKPTNKKHKTDENDDDFTHRSSKLDDPPLEKHTIPKSNKSEINIKIHGQMPSGKWGKYTTPVSDDESD
jgi:hypothetical protein